MENVVSRGVRKGVQWVDVTDMLAWSGHYTGIQRVTYEYAKRFEQDGAKFFAYDSKRERFFEISLKEIVEREDVVPHSAEPTNSARSIKRRIRRFIGAPYYRLDDSTRAFLHPYVQATNHTVRSIIHVIEYVGAKDSMVMVGSPYGSHREARFSKHDTLILLGAGWNEMNVLRRLRELKQDIGFCISQHINDILPIYQPHLFASELPKYFLPYIKLALETADVITVISKATKRDVETFCEQQGVLKKPEVAVVRLGDNPQVDITPSKPKDVAADEKFILAVGTFEIRKNYQLLYQAIKLAELENRMMPKIVIAGRRGWLTEDLRHVLANDPFVKAHIIWLNDVNDSELKWLYDRCMFTVFPSLAEGWGLPIAESLGYGKMCVASGVSSMLEIGEGLVDYFLPYDARECMEKIIHYSNENLYLAKNEEVAKLYKVFSWDASYKQLVDAISLS